MESSSRWRRFFAELKRRHVYRVAMVYAATAFVVVQVADLTFVRLGLPSWTVTFVIALAALGFPIALVLAWAFEVTPDGMRRTSATPVEEDAADAAEAGDPSLDLRTIVALVCALALLPAGVWWLQGERDGGPGIDRLAVLPLTNLTSDSGQEYFVQGMHNELISELQQAGVSVIARTSVMRYADQTTRARDIARELGVDALVEGQVLRTGDSVKIDARIVDPESEEYLWTASFAESLRNVESLHRGLTRAIADEIRTALSPEDEARLEEHTPVDPDAYDAYLKGVMHSQRFNPQDLNTALGYFRTALEIDSTYAPAHLGIARVWGFRAQAGLISAREARERFEPAVERARDLGGSLGREPMAATGAGVLAWREWRFQEAERAFRRAIELNGQHAETRVFYGHLLTILGRWHEAGAQAEKAKQLDPWNPFIRGLYATHLVLSRRYDDGIRVLERIFSDHPDAGFGRVPLATAYAMTGRQEEALRVLKDDAESRGDRDLVVALERGRREGGYREALGQAVEALAARPEGEYRIPFRAAQLSIMAGEEEKALTWLERAFEARDQNMPYMGVAPIFEPLHDHPRFRELAGRVGVPIVTARRGRDR